MVEEFNKEEIKTMLKGFIAKALSMDEVNSYCIIAIDKKGVKSHSLGSELEIYGMLDYVKRKMFVDMASRSDPDSHYKITRAMLIEDFKKAIREEKANDNIVGRETP